MTPGLYARPVLRRVRAEIVANNKFMRYQSPKDLEQWEDEMDEIISLLDEILGAKGDSVEILLAEEK